MKSFFRRSKAILRVKIKGLYYIINGNLELEYHKMKIPVTLDSKFNFWILLDRELIQLRKFELNGIYSIMEPAVPEFVLRTLMPRQMETAGFEVNEVLRYWSLSNLEYYMLLTFSAPDC